MSNQHDRVVRYWLIIVGLTAAACSSAESAPPTQATHATSLVELEASTTIPSVFAVSTSPSIAERAAPPEYDVEVLRELFPPGEAWIYVWLSCCDGSAEEEFTVTIDDGEDRTTTLQMTVASQDGFDPLYVGAEAIAPGEVVVQIDITDGSSCEQAFQVQERSAVFVNAFHDPGCVLFVGTQWLSTTGEPVSRAVLEDRVGHAHCDHESAHILMRGRTAYVRDPEGVFPAWFFSGAHDRREFAILERLPVETVDSGYRSTGRELWWSADDDYAFIRTATGIEQWPRAESVPTCH